jgi:hypothetical protein
VLRSNIWAKGVKLKTRFKAATTYLSNINITTAIKGMEKVKIKTQTNKLCYQL